MTFVHIHFLRMAFSFECNMVPRIRNRLRRGFTRRFFIFGLVMIVFTSTYTIFVHNDASNFQPWYHSHSRTRSRQLSSRTIKKYNANFTWDTNHPFCGGGGVGNAKIEKNSIAIIVHSARQNFLQRMVIRQTWGVRKMYGDWWIAAVVFMVGTTGGPHEMEDVGQSLEAERNYFGDIVARDFVDTYKNLTLKSIMAYEWLATACPMVDIVIKTDDDVVINLKQLAHELPATGLVGTSTFFCIVFPNRTTFRDPKSFWYVSEEEYEEDIFPPHCAGLAYVTTMTVVRKVVSVVASFDKKLWIDDVFLTGLVPHRFNLRVVQNSSKTIGGWDDEESEIIEHFHAPLNWYFWPDHNPRDHKDILKHWLNPNGTDPHLQKFLNKYFLKRVFFLVDHGKNFRQDFLQIWNAMGGDREGRIL